MKYLQIPSASIHDIIIYTIQPGIINNLCTEEEEVFLMSN